MRNEYSLQLSKLLYNCKLKNKEAHLYFKGLSEDGGGRIFLKSLRNTSFKKDLSNEPNFRRIHLAGQTVPLRSSSNLMTKLSV
jgi:hypothetical protein